jgi:small-conductance mechanosensitive channel
MMTVDNRFGVRARVTSRYVVVRGLDGIEAIVPNETLVTTTVLNHSYTSRDVRVALTVQISYESDVDLAMKLLEQIALSEPRVLRGANAPAVLLLRFAENGIDLEWASGSMTPRTARQRASAVPRHLGVRGTESPSVSPRRRLTWEGRVADCGPGAIPPKAPRPSTTVVNGLLFPCGWHDNA